MSDNDKPSEPTESTPLLISTFVREFLAVGLLLLLESRIRGYDYMNAALVLFLILITVRMPYINSYAYIFETFSMPKWAKTRSHGLKNDARSSFRWPYFITVFAAHIGAGIAAAAARVYLDVQYGTELVPGAGNGTLVNQGLKVDIDALKDYSSYWFVTDRKKCFADMGLSGQLVSHFPLDSNACVSSTMMYIWYAGEEVAFVFCLCVCFIHIWLGSGITTEGQTKAPPNPFKRDYWSRLFKLSFILTFINMALVRAFPTAHGSLHNTVYALYYQSWGVNVHLVDTTNYEAHFRIAGGLVGVFISYLYSSALSNTSEPGSDPWMYKLWWGFDPPPVERPPASNQSAPAYYPVNDSSEYQRFFDAFKDTERPSPNAYYARGAQFAATQLRIPYSLSTSSKA